MLPTLVVADKPIANELCSHRFQNIKSRISQTAPRTTHPTVMAAEAATHEMINALCADYDK
jgi:hypothetical protein